MCSIVQSLLHDSSLFVKVVYRPLCLSPSTALKKVVEKVNLLRFKNRTDGVSVQDMQPREETRTG